MATNNMDEKETRGRANDSPGAFFLGLVFILLAVPALHAQVTGNSILSIFNNYWPSWSSLMFIAMALGALVAAMAWMYGSFASDDKFKAWAKKELVESFYSVLIWITAVWLVVNLGAYMVMLPAISPWNDANAHAWQNYVTLRCGTPTGATADLERPCHIRLAEDYLQILAAATEAQALDIQTFYTPLSVGSTLGVTVQGMPDPSGQLRLSPLVGLSMPLETLGGLFDVATKNLMALRFQQYLLDFLHLAFFPLFLTMGLFLRSLYFTRRLGGLLIALAMGFYLVFPLMYVFFHAVLFSMSGPWTALAGVQINTVDVGHGLYTVNVETSGQDFSGLVQPDPNSNTYSSNCQNGKLDVGEECNEYPNTTWTYGPNAGQPRDDAKLGPLSCPPHVGLDQSQPVQAGKEGNFYCDYNSCTCQSRYSAGRTGSFSADFQTTTDPATYRTQLKNSGTLLANVCYPTSDGQAQLTADQLQAQQERENQFVLQTQKTWLSKLTSGFGRAIGVMLVNDDLLGANGFIDNLAKLLIFSLVAPFIAIMASLAGVKALSPMLGGDVEIAGLTRLI